MRGALVSWVSTSCATNRASLSKNIHWCIILQCTDRPNAYNSSGFLRLHVALHASCTHRLWLPDPHFTANSFKSMSCIEALCVLYAIVYIHFISSCCICALSLCVVFASSPCTELQLYDHLQFCLICYRQVMNCQAIYGLPSTASR